MRTGTTMCCLAALLAGAAVGCHSNKSQQAATASNTDPSSLEGVPMRMQSDALFMRNTAMGGMTEIELGRLAVNNKDGSQAVRDFGQRMVNDHTAADAELTRIARAEGIALPTTLDAEHRALVNRFAALSGAAFDGEYMTLMVSDHQDVISAFEHESEFGAIPAVRQFAQETLPTIREHLVMAHQAQSVASAAEH